MREQIDRIKNWKQFLNENSEHDIKVNNITDLFHYMTMEDDDKFIYLALNNKYEFYNEFLLYLDEIKELQTHLNKIKYQELLTILKNRKLTLNDIKNKFNDKKFLIMLGKQILDESHLMDELKGSILFRYENIKLVGEMWLIHTTYNGSEIIKNGFKGREYYNLGTLHANKKVKELSKNGYIFSWSLEDFIEIPNSIEDEYSDVFGNEIIMFKSTKSIYVELQQEYMQDSHYISNINDISNLIRIIFNGNKFKTTNLHQNLENESLKKLLSNIIKL